MKRTIKNLLCFLVLAAFAPAFAGHGPLTTMERDAWINQSVETLVQKKLIPASSKKVSELTNLEVAQMTKKAAEIIVAQADWDLPPALPGGDIALPGAPLGSEPFGLPPPSALPAAASPLVTQNLRQLVEEFKDELSAMGTDLAILEDKIYEIQRRNESFALQQEKYLKRTGTEVSGYSRGYFCNYRGFGPGANAVYGPMVYNVVMFQDINFKSVPVPKLLFDARVRCWRTIGLYYAEVINPRFDVRWISLTGYLDNFSITGGDFFQHYTPLTLWNYEVPVFTFIEPISYYRNRKDVEEVVFVNQGPDFRLRGFQTTADYSPKDNQVFSSVKAQAMVSPLKLATEFRYGGYLAGSQVSMGFFEDNLEIKGAGLVLWEDLNSANASDLYAQNPSFTALFAKQYKIGSVSGRLNIPFEKEVSFTATGEYAGSNYQDDLNNPDRVFEDWAAMATGALNVYGAHLTAKYVNNGPFFYSPGAQTNRYTPGSGPGYLSTNANQDEFLLGYLNRYVFPGVNRPAYAPYDRMVENMLPYGDASPNRMGTVLGFSADIGQKGWLKPQASYVLKMEEIQPNLVLSPDGMESLAVESATTTANARTFKGYEGALTLSLSKAYGLENKTYQLAFDYKHQETDLGLGEDPFKVDTLIGALDFNLPISGFDSLLLSVAYGQAKTAGREYVLANSGNPPTLGQFPFYLDTSSLGDYVLIPLNITKTSWAFGLMYPVVTDMVIRGDYFINEYTWKNNETIFKDYYRRDQIWRITYEVRF